MTYQRIVVDAMPVRHGGGAEFVQAELAALLELTDPRRYDIRVSPWSEVPRIAEHATVVPVRHVGTRVLYEQFNIRRVEGDLLYCPINFGPVLSTPRPVVMTVHNINYFLPSLARTRYGKLGRALCHASIRRADRVIAVSETLARAVARALPECASKVEALPTNTVVWPDARQDYPAFADKYFLSVTSSAAHKRNDDVVRAWRKARLEDPQLPDLALVGNLSDVDVGRLRGAAGPVANHLRLLGPVRNRAQLRSLYLKAQALVSLTERETISMPVLEACSVGTLPVISDIQAHREVAGSVARFVSGEDELTAELLKIGSDATAPSVELEWGMSWREHARRLIEIFESLV